MAHWSVDKLPKGSRCQDFKSVPSRSSYHNSDEVDRCAKFDTTGRKGGGGGGKKGEWPKGVNGWERYTPNSKNLVVGYKGSGNGRIQVEQTNTGYHITWELSHGGVDVKSVKSKGEAIDVLRSFMGEFAGGEDHAPASVKRWEYNPENDKKKKDTPKKDKKEKKESKPKREGTITFAGEPAPKKIGGWEYTTEYDFRGITGKDEHNELAIWEKWGTDLTTRPTLNRTILVLSWKTGRKIKAGYQPSIWFVDVNGEKHSASIDNPGVTSKDPADAIENAVEYMEENPERIPEYDFPRFDLSGEARTLKYWATHVNRVQGDESTKFDVHIGKERLQAKDSDAANVILTKARARASAFESYSVEGTGWVAFNVSRLYEYVREAGVTDEMRCYVKDSPEKAVPPYVELEIDGEPQTEGLKRVWLFDVEHDIDIPDLALESTIETTGKELKRQYKGASILTDEELGLYTDGENAYTVVEGDVDNFRGEWNADVSGETDGSWYSMKYMKIVRMVRKPASTDVTLSFGENTPLKVEWETDGLAVTQYLAPRVPNDEKGAPSDFELKSLELHEHIPYCLDYQSD